VVFLRQMVPEGMNALRDVSRLSVEVSELLRKPGTTKRLEFSEEVPGLGLEMGSVRPILHFDLTLESLVEGILVGGTVRGSYALACRRCLRSFDSPFEVQVSEMLSYGGSPAADDGYEIVGDHALLEPIVRDAVILAMPLNPLCKPDCRGLCSVCGADLNVGDCGHRTERTDIRWEPLRRLTERNGD
jgi:uncharacterized protein